jgi:hypothetical protein
VALVNFMRLSSMKAAHVAVSNAANQEIRVRSGRDDKVVELCKTVHQLERPPLRSPLKPKTAFMGHPTGFREV